MDWIDIACRLPYLIVLVLGIAVSIAKCGKYRLPAILAACGFGIALVHSLSFPFAYKTLSGLIEDQMLARRSVTIVMSTVSATYVLLLLSAIFTARRTAISPLNVLEQDLNFAMTQLKEGASSHQIEERLAERGLAPSVVASLLQEIEVKQSHKAGWWNLVVGGLICLLGIGFTIASYLMAANAPGGGKYVVTYGLIVAGAVQTFRGLIQIGK